VGRLKKLLLTLLDSSYRNSNNFASLSDEEKWLAECYLPALLNDPVEVVVDQMRLVIQAYGFEAFTAIVAAASPQTQARLLALVVQALPLRMQSELLLNKLT
jgi:hypothetical protein